LGVALAWRPEPLFVLGAISQYAGAAIAVSLFDRLGAPTVALFRVVGAGVILVTVRRSWRRHWDRHLLAMAAVFGCALAAMNLSFYMAIDRLPLGNAVAIEFMGPVAVAAVGTRTLRKWAALALAALGVVVLAGVTPDVSGAGVGFALLAATFWAGYIVFGERVARSGTGVDGLGVGMLIGAVVILPVTMGGIGTAIASPVLLALALTTGLLSNAIPYGIDQVVLTRIPRARFAFLLALLPVTATLVGLVALAQQPTTAEIAGIAMVAVGILLAGE